MKINTVNQNFRGISNPISNFVQAPNGQVHVLSVQLDNIDEKDLNTFRDIKKMLNFHPQEIEGDVLTITQTEFDDNVNRFHINGKPILLGSDLNELSEYEFNTKAEKLAYKEEERAHVKLFTFIASLTKRMANTESLPIDEDIHYVAQNTFASLTDVFNNKRLAHNIVFDSLLHPKPFQPHANQINQFIQKSMKIFFKV